MECEKHRDWFDEFNHGITHFGLDPKLFNIELVFADVFHLRSSITRSLLHCFQSCIEKFSENTIRKFIEDFEKLWESNFYSSQFANNQTLSRIQGKHVKKWITSMDSFVELVKKSVKATRGPMKDFVEVCKLWPKITEFIHIVDIDDKNDYLKKLEEFKKNVKLFHKHGASNFLTSGLEEGDAETFYCHALRFYLPQQAEWLFKKCKVGLGVFLMQGFEHRNKQSKRCCATKSNGKGNPSTQSLCALFELFFHKIETS